MPRMVVFVLVLVLSACAAREAQTPAQKVFGVQADYAALLNVAVTYESQPRCMGNTQIGCSDPGVVDKIRKADNIAYAALKAAQDTVRTPGATESNTTFAISAAINAIGALRTILIETKVLK